MSDNWVVQNLENALETWNEKLSEIWTLITTTPQNFKGGNIWKVIVDINGAVQAIGLALLVLFFVIGMVKTCGSFTDVKKPEHALKLFVRFALAKGVITYGMELMLALFNIVQGTISTIMNAAGFGTPEQTTLPTEMVTTIEDCGFFESIAVFKTVVYTNSSDSFKYYEFTDAENAAEFDAYVAKCKELSLYDTGVSAEYGDKLISLSTCEYSRNNGRLVVVAKRVD